MSDSLFDTFKLGQKQLNNRVVMAPMTRCRASAEHLPTELMELYYRQRANAGLIITEGTAPSANGLGYARIPGLFSAEHVSGWRKITNKVHQQDGSIYVQLMHTGRVSHPLNMPPGSTIMAPSAITLSGEMWTDQEGMQPYPTPTAMAESDIKQAIEEFAKSAELAIEAGFDGVEIHGANGYLIDQFLNTASNQRNDQWGGSIENRTRFAIEITKTIVNRIGGQRTGIRVSPYGVFSGMAPDTEMPSLYTYLADELSKLGLAYIHIVDHSSMGAPEVPPEMKSALRDHFSGAIILSGGYDADRAESDLAENKGDLVAFGRPYISNPDLVQQMKNAAPIAEPNPDTFYTPGEEGYTDYQKAT